MSLPSSDEPSQSMFSPTLDDPLTPLYDLTHLTHPPLCIVLTSKDDPLPGTLNFFHPTRMTPSMYLSPRPRMTPLYDYVLTPQDATPPSSFTNPGYPPPPSHTPHATPPSSQCNHPPQMRPHLPGTPKVNINQCRADLLPNLVSDTEGQLYYYCYLPSTNRY